MEVKKQITPKKTEQPKNPLDERIGKRIAALRNARKWSGPRLAKECKTLSPSRIGNYEQGTRRVSIEAAQIIAKALETSAAHILCLDDDQPILGTAETKMITNLRKLAPEHRTNYMRRIDALAQAFADPLPDEKVIDIANPKYRKRKRK